MAMARLVELYQTAATDAEILRNAGKLIMTGWSKSVPAHDYIGHPVQCSSPDATHFNLTCAIHRSILDWMDDGARAMTTELFISTFIRLRGYVVEATAMKFLRKRESEMAESFFEEWAADGACMVSALEVLAIAARIAEESELGGGQK